jgi:hypothetical protein
LKPPRSDWRTTKSKDNYSNANLLNPLLFCRLRVLYYKKGLVFGGVLPGFGFGAVGDNFETLKKT